MKHFLVSFISIVFLSRARSSFVNRENGYRGFRNAHSDGLPAHVKGECPEGTPASGHSCDRVGRCDYDWKPCPDGSGGYATHAHCVDRAWKIAHTFVHCVGNNEHEPSLQRLEQPEITTLKHPDGSKVATHGGKHPTEGRRRRIESAAKRTTSGSLLLLLAGFFCA